MSRLALRGRIEIGSQGALKQSGYQNWHHRGSRRPSGDQGFCMIVSMLAEDHASLQDMAIFWGTLSP